MMASGENADLYYLPLSETTAEAILENAVSLNTLSIPELAAVVLILKLATHARPDMTSAGIEARYARVLDWLLDDHSLETVADELAQSFSAAEFAAGMAKLQRLNYRLLDEVTVAERSFLTKAGRWDFGFRLRQAAKLNPLQVTVEIQPQRCVSMTDSQSRLFNQIRREVNEHLNLQGLAGVGKSIYVGFLLELLSRNKVLVLAQTTQQVQVLIDRLGQNFTGMSFGQLASKLLFTPPSLYRAPERQRWQLGYQVSDQQVADWLEFREVAGLSPAYVARLCTRAVRSFCYSGQSYITERNFEVGQVLAPADFAVLLEYANLLWRETTQPRLRHVRLPIRVYHLLKMLALDESIQLNEAAYSHVIIDEAHDLPIPLLQFLDRCPQATITLGDVCQRLDGLPVRRGAHVREREIFQSVRAGRQIEEVLNPLIAAIPYADLTPLEGAKDRKTLIEYYDRSSVPEDGTAILVKSEWGLFEWFQRLAAANADFGMMPGSENQFRRFVNDCIELYHYGSRPKHGALFRYQSWSQLAADRHKEHSFDRIQTMLERGYSSMDFERSLAVLNRSGRPRILLGRVTDARSMEMDKVMLGRDLLSPVRAGDMASAGKVFSAIYTGGSRARHKLIVPGQLRDWVADQSVKITKGLMAGLL